MHGNNNKNNGMLRDVHAHVVITNTCMYHCTIIPLIMFFYSLSVSLFCNMLLQDKAESQCCENCETFSDNFHTTKMDNCT